MGFLVRLWARFETVRGGNNGALLAMQTGFGMARHVGQGPTTMQAMVGTAIGGLMCREVELFIKGEDAPNLYHALADLPRPLVYVAKAIDSERANLTGLNALIRKRTEKMLEPAHERILLIEKRLGNNLNVLQYVEALRDYAAAHDGRLPEKSSDLTDLELPKDLVSGKPFEYRRTEAGAVVTSTMPEGGDPVFIVRYEVVLKK